MQKKWLKNVLAVIQHSNNIVGLIGGLLTIGAVIGGLVYVHSQQQVPVIAGSTSATAPASLRTTPSGSGGATPTGVTGTPSGTIPNGGPGPQVTAAPTSTSIGYSPPTAVPTPIATTRPIAPGTVLYTTNWSNGLDGWAGPNGNSGTPYCTATNSTLHCPGSSLAAPSEFTMFLPSYLPETPNYALEASIKVNNAGLPGNSGNYFGLFSRYPGSLGGVQSGYVGGIEGSFGTLDTPVYYNPHTALFRAEGGYNPGSTTHLYRFESKSNTFTMSIDGAQVFSETDQNNTLPDAGELGLEVSGCDITVFSFQVIAL